MVLAIVLALVMISAILMIVKRESKYALLNLSCICLAFFLFWLLVYIAKKGGITQSISQILFLTNGLRVKMQYLLVRLDTMSFAVALGRYLFPALLLHTSLLMVTFIPRNWLRLLNVVIYIPPVILLALYRAKTFESIITLSATAKVWLINGSLYTVIFYILVAFFVLLFEFRQISFGFHKRLFVGQITLIFAMGLLYLVYCPQDPGQVYMFYRDESMRQLGLWYLSPSMGVRSHIIILAIMFVSSILSIWSMWTMTVRTISESQSGHELNRKFDIARIGGNIFVHSIKNQILAALVYDKRIAQELAKDTPDLSKLQEQTMALHENNENMLAHINSLYQMLKEKRLQLAPVHVDQFYEKVCQAYLQKRPNVDIRISDRLPGHQVLLDESTMSEVFLNLLQNAWEASGPDLRNEVPIELSYSLSQGCVVMEVRDHGCGVSKENLRRVFEPFFTEHNTNYNWGMGLYFARRVVKEHHGNIFMKSEIGCGSSVYIVLPCYRKGTEAKR